MVDLFTLLTDAALAGVVGNALYEGSKESIKHAWQQLRHKSTDKLLLDAFVAAVDATRPILAAYTDQGVVTVDRAALQQALQQDLGIDPETISINKLTSTEFVTQVAGVLADRQVLLLGGHTLPAVAYEQLLHNLIQQAIIRFKDAVVKDEPAFRRALLEGSQNNQVLTQEVLDTLKGVDNKINTHTQVLYQLLTQQLAAEITRNRTLEQEITTLRRASPGIQFGFWENDQINAVLVKSLTPRDSNGPTDEDLAREVANAKARATNLISEVQQPPLSSLWKMGTPFSVTKPALGQYSKEWEKYFRKLDFVLKWQRAQHFGQQEEISFVLKNTGTNVLNDLDLEIRFPAESFAVDMQDIDDEEEGAPKLPFEPLSPSIMARVVNMYQPPEPIRPKRVYAEDRRIITYEHQKLRRQEALHVNLLVYLPPMINGDFEIEYTIHCDELPDVIRGTLRVVLQSPSSDWRKKLELHKAQQEPPPSQ